MNVKAELGPDYDVIVSELIATGNYSTREDVVRDALRRLVEDRRRYERRLAFVHAELDAGLASGEPTPFDFEAFIVAKHAERGASTHGCHHLK